MESNKVRWAFVMAAALLFFVMGSSFAMSQTKEEVCEHVARTAAAAIYFRAQGLTLPDVLALNSVAFPANEFPESSVATVSIIELIYDMPMLEIVELAPLDDETLTGIESSAYNGCLRGTQ